MFSAYKNLVPMTRIERVTSPLPRECSTTEPHEHSIPLFLYYHNCNYNFQLQTGAGDEVRTRDILLGRQVLYQLSYSRKSLHKALNNFELFQPLARRNITSHFWWRELDSNQRRRKPTDLQSAPFSRSGISPLRTLNFHL